MRNLFTVKLNPFANFEMHRYNMCTLYNHPCSGSPQHRDLLVQKLCQEIPLSPQWNIPRSLRDNAAAFFEMIAGHAKNRKEAQVAAPAAQNAAQPAVQAAAQRAVPAASGSHSSSGGGGHSSGGDSLLQTPKIYIKVFGISKSSIKFPLV